MRIDWHTHIHDPVDQARPYWQGRCPMTMENVLAAHELAQLDKTVISNAVHYLRFCKTVKETVDALESSNRYLAKCRDTHPDKFIHSHRLFSVLSVECFDPQTKKMIL